MSFVPDAAHGVEVDDLRLGLGGEAGVDGVGLPLLVQARRVGERVGFHEQACPIVPTTMVNIIIFASIIQKSYIFLIFCSCFRMILRLIF